jgi:5-methylcytosine-specific restriction endonuclease McrA
VRFDRESWRKLYVAESVEHRLLPLFTRGLRDYLIRHAEQDGTLLPRTSSPAADLGRVLNVNPKERKQLVEAVDELLRIGFLSWDSDCRLWITRFEEAQDARSPGAIRQERWRANNPEHQQRRSNMARDFTLVGRLRKLDGSACSYCERELDFRNGKKPNQATVDHVVPMSRGGSDEESNLVLACKECNERKSNRTPEQANMSLRNARVTSLRNVSGDVTSDETRRDETRDPLPPSVFAMHPGWNPTEDTYAAFDVAMIPRWASEQIVGRFRAHFVADKKDVCADPDWNRRCSRWVFKDWNNPEKRPRQAANDSGDDYPPVYDPAANQ